MWETLMVMLVAFYSVFMTIIWFNEKIKSRNYKYDIRNLHNTLNALEDTTKEWKGIANNLQLQLDLRNEALAEVQKSVEQQLIKLRGPTEEDVFKNAKHKELPKW